MGLQIGKELRRPLHLIENGAVRIACQQVPGIGLGYSPNIRVFQRQVGLSGNAALARVVLPDWRGPQMATMGNPRARRSRVFWAVRGIMTRG
ncbi:MAG: hypothetical protein V2B20_20385 [Pseudomonadota bacterium]